MAWFSFRLLHHHIVVDPVYGMEVLNHMWATEPVGTTSILLTSAGLLITLGFKLLDFMWDIYKEKSRRGRLKVELTARQLPSGEAALMVIASNIGREPIVIREIGHLKPTWFGGKHFIPFHPQKSKLPHALNALEILQMTVGENETDLMALSQKFRVKDSLGRLWEPNESEIRQVRRQLSGLQAVKPALPKRDGESEQKAQAVKAGSQH